MKKKTDFLNKSSVDNNTLNFNLCTPEYNNKDNNNDNNNNNTRLYFLPLGYLLGSSWRLSVKKRNKGTQGQVKHPYPKEDANAVFVANTFLCGWHKYEQRHSAD